MTAFRDILQAKQRPARAAPRGPQPLAAPWRPMRQKQAARWAVAAPPGQTLRGAHHRAMRLLMEALELARVSGLSEAQMQALLSAAFARDAGDPRRTVGGLGVALLMLCDALNIDADEAEVVELNRILALLQSQPEAPTQPAGAARAAEPARAPRAQRNKETHEDLGHPAH